MQSKFYVLFFCLTLCFQQLGFTQALTAKAKFLQETIRTAEEVQFCISIQHPKNIQLVFPDSTYDFSPFEYVHKSHFTTKSDTSMSLDSAVFTLTTFEIDPLQTLKLPVYVLTEQGDSVEVFSNNDSLLFITAVSQMPNPIVLSEETSLQEVDYDFNYYYVGIAISIIFVIAGSLLFLFKKSIFLRYHEYLLNKRHKKFLLQFQNQVSFSREEELQNLVWFWKDYLSKLEKKSFHAYTSKDLHKYYHDQPLYDELKKVDYYLYAKPTEINIEALKEFAEYIFRNKKEELKVRYGK